MANLKGLLLFDTQVTDAGLAHLKGLTKLKHLGLAGAPVTDAGVAELKKVLPNCNIGHSSQNKRRNQPSATVESSKPFEKLNVGDPAPPLAINQWVKGDSLEKFELGNIYVIEFWATWCPPCRTSMSHLSQLQEQYGEKVTIVGVTLNRLKLSAIFYGRATRRTKPGPML